MEYAGFGPRPREDAHTEADPGPLCRAVLKEPGTARNSERACVTIGPTENGRSPIGRAIRGTASRAGIGHSAAHKQTQAANPAGHKLLDAVARPQWHPAGESAPSPNGCIHVEGEVGIRRLA